MKDFYKFGDRVFEIETQYSFFYNFARSYLSTDKKNATKIKISNEDIAKWKIDNKDDSSDELVELSVVLMKVSHELASSNTFLMHGSSFYIDNPNNGFIITATSGTGKSTHANILRCLLGNRFHYINDDKPFVKYDDKSFKIYGSPWSGKTNLENNESAKLKAIFILEQSLSNSVNEISISDALSILAKQVYIPEGKLATSVITDLMVKMIKDTPIYLLKVNMSQEAGEVSYSIMKQYIQ